MKTWSKPSRHSERKASINHHHHQQLFVKCQEILGADFCLGKILLISEAKSGKVLLMETLKGVEGIDPISRGPWLLFLLSSWQAFSLRSISCSCSLFSSHTGCPFVPGTHKAFLTLSCSLAVPPAWSILGLAPSQTSDTKYNASSSKRPFLAFLSKIVHSPGASYDITQFISFTALFTI